MIVEFPGNTHLFIYFCLFYGSVSLVVYSCLLLLSLCVGYSYALILLRRREVLLLCFTCNFQQCSILINVDSDEPVQPLLSLETPNGVHSLA